MPACLPALCPPHTHAHKRTYTHAHTHMHTCTHTHTHTHTHARAHTHMHRHADLCHPCVAHVRLQSEEDAANFLKALPRLVKAVKAATGCVCVPSCTSAAPAAPNATPAPASPGAVAGTRPHWPARIGPPPARRPRPRRTHPWVAPQRCAAAPSDGRRAPCGVW